jgi:hypothetical protein
MSAKAQSKRKGKIMESFTLFSKEGKGKRSKNDPCVVSFEPINIDSLSAEQKQALVTSLVKDKARAKYAKLSKGYRMLGQFMTDAKAMLEGFGLTPDDDQIKKAALMLASRDEIQLAFEPVVSFELTTDEILAESDDDDANDTAAQ